jgi:1A family penicillin-binding protein
MKYVVLTMSFLLLAALLACGIFFYGGYLAWVRTRDDVLSRLYYFKQILQEERAEHVSLSPDLKKNEKTVIYDRNLKVIGTFSTGARKILTYDQLPPLLVDTVLLMEDRRFFSHKGIDPRGTLGAVVENVRALAYVRGGSTITQQLAKILFTDSRKTVRRKIYELFCTLEIEKRFTKKEILALYLNAIYFGHHNYGIENAAEFYFQKKVFDLDIYEVSLLAGMIPGPNRYSPLLHRERSARRQKIVLNTLVSNDLLRADSAVEGFARFWEHFARIERRPAVSIWSMEKNDAPYFVEHVRKELESSLGEQRVKTGGLKVYTSLDIDMNRAAVRALADGLTLQNLRTKEIVPDSVGRVEGALIALDTRDGSIRAMVGGSGFTFDNQFNRAVNAQRQIGSAFKPFIFAAGIETGGVRPDSTFMDEPLELRTPTGVWRPENYNQRYYGRVSLEFALKKSLNSVAVQLLQQVGAGNVIAVIGKALDLSEEETRNRFKEYPSIALGVYSFSPLEIARAYAVFPNRGEKVFPISIVRVEDDRGDTILDNQRAVKKMRAEYDLEKKLSVLTGETAETISGMLREVVRKGGTAHQAFVTAGLSIDACGKTGTTDNYTDAWFIGYNENVIAAVWVGFDDPSYTLGKGQAGGVVAAPIWANFINLALWRE